MIEINLLISEETKNIIEDNLEFVERITRSVSDSSENIKTTLNNIDEIAKHVNIFAKKIRPLVENGIPTIKETGNVEENPITNAILGLSKEDNLLNTAPGLGVAGVLNLAVSVIGFAIISEKISYVSNKIDTIQDKVDTILENQEKEKRKKWSKLLSEINGYIQDINTGAFDWKIHRDSLSKTLNEVEPEINDLLVNYWDKPELVINVLLPMVIAFGRLTKEYSILYYFTSNVWPNLKEKWVQTLKKFSDNEKILKPIQIFLYANYPEWSESEMTSSMNYIDNELVKGTYTYLVDEIEYVEKSGITKDEYYNLPKLICECIKREG